MSLFDFLKPKLGSDWPDLPPVPLELALPACTLNNIPLGAPVDALRIFGRPRYFLTKRKNIILTFEKNRVIAHITNGLITCLDVELRFDSLDADPEGTGAPTVAPPLLIVRFSDAEPIALTPDTPATDFQKYLPPKDPDSSDDSISWHEMGEKSLGIEIIPAGTIDTITISN